MPPPPDTKDEVYTQSDYESDDEPEELPRLVRAWHGPSTEEEPTLLPEVGITLRIGRLPGAKGVLQLDDPERPGQPASELCPLTHREHASITNKNGHYWLTALGSRMLTHVNGSQMRPHNTHIPIDDTRQLQHGDSIRFGGQPQN